MSAESQKGDAARDRVLALVREVSEELHPGRKLRRVALDSSLDKDLGLDSLGRAELISRLERVPFSLCAGKFP